jgi:hypothetical protein
MSGKCLNCENMRKQLVVLEGALAISAEMANALKPLFPDPKLLSQEKRDQWQKVVRIAEHRIKQIALKVAESHGSKPRYISNYEAIQQALREAGVRVG